MVQEPIHPDNRTRLNSVQKKARKSPNLNQCKAVAGGGVARAVALQKLCQYCSARRFPIDGNLYSAPTTEMLLKELPYARSTIQREIAALDAKGVIEIKRKHFHRSPRRYVRLLIDPTSPDIPSDGEVSATKSDDDASSAETVTQSDDGMVQYKKDKKKKIEKKKSQPFQGEIDPGDFEPKSKQANASNHFQPDTQDQSGKKPRAFSTTDRPDLWEPRNFFEKSDLRKFESHAESDAYRITERVRKKRSWDNGTCKVWHQRLTARLVREFRRSKQKGIDAAKP